MLADEAHSSRYLAEFDFRYNNRNLSDAERASDLLRGAKCPSENLFLRKLFADGGYQGPIFEQAVARVLTQIEVEIVERSDKARGFEVLPRRWVVERTFAWLNRCRRLGKDVENRTRNALAFLQLASIRLMMRKLCNP